MNTLAMVFPGQGSQIVGMLSDVASKYALVQTTFAEASEVLGYDLWQQVQSGPVEKLNKTWHAQPALLASSIALWRIWHYKRGKMPSLLAGHSLGEYSALVCAGSLDFTTAIALVTLRAKLMQEAVPYGKGAMYAIIGLRDNIVSEACLKASQEQIVSLVNFNSVDQVVIAGHTEAVKRASLLCKQAGAKHIIPLPVSVPSHCALMKPAAKKLALKLKSITFVEPQIPVVNNVDVRVESDPDNIRNALVRQLYNPVRWTEIIEYFASHGVKLLLEIGPSKVLTNLTKRIASTISPLSVNNLASLEATIEKTKIGNRIEL